jgi:CHASE2 domain-containing sensor protein
MPSASLAILDLGPGSLNTGFASVTLSIGRVGLPIGHRSGGALPSAPGLALALGDWRRAYRQSQRVARPIGRPKAAIATPDQCRSAAKTLSDRLNEWLRSPEFQPIREAWLAQLRPQDPTRLLLQTQDLELWRLPWSAWEFLDRYPALELSYGPSVFGAVAGTESWLSPPIVNANPDAINILAILGDSSGIDLAGDRQVLTQLPQANLTLLEEPDRQALSDRLWEQSWQVLFFAGHSETGEMGKSTVDPGAGYLQINADDCLSLAELRHALKRSIGNGLQLAIFNSCDGLGLARDLADLQIPQLVVMREPVADRVAQLFLTYFLGDLAQGIPLDRALRQSRERLQAIELDYPNASWLPVLVQNPASQSFCWPQPVPIAKPNLAIQPQRGWQRPLRSLLLTLGAAALTIGLRQTGLLDGLERQAYDQLLRLSPIELPDRRILIIEVTEADVDSQPQAQRRGSLSDEALEQLLAKLIPNNPSVIGLDIYRNFAARPQLARQLTADRLVATCRVSSPTEPGIAPPPEVAADRLGFSDLSIDADRVVRRQLLSLAPAVASPCQAHTAFSAQVALQYLAQQGIQLDPSNPDRLRLGPVSLDPIGLDNHNKAPTLFTSWLRSPQTGGYPILLRYRQTGDQPPFDRVSLGDVLAGRLPSGAIADRIILIGTTAQSFRDYSATPLTPEMPGVVLQAHMVSQLVSAALDRRSLLWVWPIGGELVWVGFWSGVGIGTGAILGRFGRGANRWGIGVIGLGAIGGCGYGAMLLGGWIPIVPPAIGLGLGLWGAGLADRFADRFSSPQSRPAEL